MQIFDNILFDRYFFFSAEPRRIESAAVMDFFSAVARKMLGRAIILNFILAAVPAKLKLQSISIFGFGLHMKLSFYLILNCLLLCIFHNSFPTPLLFVVAEAVVIFAICYCKALANFRWPWVSGSVEWANGNMFWSRGRMSAD